MDWKGIPFKFNSEPVVDHVRLALDSLPKIIVDSPTDYMPTVLTALVSLAAGLIPAGIAVWTFRCNAENMKSERAAQEEFLKNERELQHKFLENERSAQQISLEKDRETQLLIARQNFNMQVLSANRQAWIIALRDYSAEYIVSANDMVHVSIKYSIAAKYLKTFDAKDLGNEKVLKVYNEAVVSLEEKAKLMNELSAKVRLQSSKIKMMLNPSEPAYKKVSDIFSRILEENYAAALNAENENSRAEEIFSNVRVSTDELLGVIQSVLKDEWVRVKSGL